MEAGAALTLSPSSFGICPEGRKVGGDGWEHPQLLPEAGMGEARSPCLPPGSDGGWVPHGAPVPGGGVGAGRGGARLCKAAINGAGPGGGAMGAASSGSGPGPPQVREVAPTASPRPPIRCLTPAR